MAGYSTGYRGIERDDHQQSDRSHRASNSMSRSPVALTKAGAAPEAAGAAAGTGGTAGAGATPGAGGVMTGGSSIAC
jgi:hypothetical protein